MDEGAFARNKRLRATQIERTGPLGFLRPSNLNLAWSLRAPFKWTTRMPGLEFHCPLMYFPTPVSVRKSHYNLFLIHCDWLILDQQPMAVAESFRAARPLRRPSWAALQARFCDSCLKTRGKC